MTKKKCNRKSNRKNTIRISKSYFILINILTFSVAVFGLIGIVSIGAHLIGEQQNK